MNRVVTNIDDVATILKLLGDKTRLTMMALLDNKNCCVCELVEFFQMSQPAISQHLRKLKDAGLLNETKKAQWVFILSIRNMKCIRSFKIYWLMFLTSKKN